MAQPTFPNPATEGDHYVEDNRLWVYTSYVENGDTKFRWVLWGNLTYVGVPGDKGTDGVTGATGSAGSTGPRGYRGASGASGATGSTGPTGEPGTSLRLMGVVEGFEQLWAYADMENSEANPSVNEGDMFIVKDGSTKYDPNGKVIGAPDNEAWVYAPGGIGDTWNIDPWVGVGPIQGPPGLDGASGDIGLQGPRGDDGATGAPGLNGAHGGAFAHMVDMPPAQGPEGKIYMVRGDFSMYVTTGK